MIYNFGSLNIDYVYSVEDFVKSGETISSSRMDTFAGGKGLNQSAALAKAGTQVRHCGFVSKQSGFLLETLRDSGVDTGLVEEVDSTNGHAIIQVNKNGQNCIMLHGGTNRMVDSKYALHAASFVRQGDIVLFQNETSSNAEMMRASKKNGAVIVLNPSPMDADCLALPLELVDIFILNETEGEALAGTADPQEIIEQMSKRYPTAKILLTLGKKGSIFFCNGSQFAQDIVSAGKTVDTTAAGDTFTGYYLAGIAGGAGDKEAVYCATVASGIAVTRKGASPSIPTMSEVQKQMHR